MGIVRFSLLKDGKMKTRNLVVMFSVILNLAICIPASAGVITLTFDDIPAHTGNESSEVIREDYAHLGVHFNSDQRHGGIVRGGLSNGDPGNWDLEGTNGPQFLGHNSFGYTGLIEFDMPVSQFKVDAASGHASLTNLTFDAYIGNTLVESVTLAHSPEEVWTTIELSAVGITRIEYRASRAYGLDNLRFIPEPASAAMLLIGSVAMLRRAGSAHS